MQAQRDGVSLSEIEQKMLLFSETAPTLPDAAEANESFDRDYDVVDYEERISNLIHRARLADRPAPEANRSWTEALKSLHGKDYYLLAMIDEACGKERPRGDFIRLIGTAIAIVGLILGLVLFFTSR